jgi:hypothetical protein
LYGLPEDLDLSFFVDTTLTQLGMGEHQIIFSLHPDVHLSVEFPARSSSNGRTAQCSKLMTTPSTPRATRSTTAIV